MPDKIKTLYDNLVTEGYELPDFNTFTMDMTDNAKRQKFHGSLVSEGYDLPDFETFTVDMGFTEKKKAGFSQELPKPIMPSGEKLPQGVGASVKVSSPSPSKLPSTTTTTTSPKTTQSRVKLYSEVSKNIQNRIPKLVEQYNIAEANGDAQAMQELEAQINNDSQKIDYFQKAIEGQNMLRNAQLADDSVGGILERSGKRLVGSIAGGVNFLDDFINQMANEISPIGYNEKTKKEFEEFQKTYNSKGELDRPSDVIAKAGKILLKDATEKAQASAAMRPYKGEVWTPLKEGKIKDAVSNAALGFGESFLPSAGFILAPALSTMGLAEENVDEKRTENGQVTSKDYLVGSLKASFELAFENLFGTGKALKELVGKLGREAAIEQVEQVTKAGLKEWAKKTGTTIVEEPIGEGLTQLMSNVVDKADGKDVGYFDGVPDAALIGLFGGVTQGTATTTVSHYIDRSKLKEAEAAKAKAQTLQEQALEAESPVVAEAIEKEAEKLNDWADQTIEWNNEIGANASPEIVAQIEETNAQIDELEAALPEATPEIAEAITAQIEELSVQAQELAKTAEEQAMLIIEGLKQPINTQEDATKIGEIEQGNITEREGVTEQQQGGQENRVNQEGDVTKSESFPSNSNQSTESRKVEEVVKEQPKEEPKPKEVKEVAPAKEQEVVVKSFKKGDGGTKGIFEGEDGKLYKSIEPQESVQDKDGNIKRKTIKDSVTDEYNILSELQDNPNIPKVGEIVNTTEGKAFEIEKLDEVDTFTKDEYREIQSILNDLNDKGYHVGDKVTVMKRPETGELVIIDFSAGYKGVECREMRMSICKMSAKSYQKQTRLILSKKIRLKLIGTKPMLSLVMNQLLNTI
jgi:hypothetical protein